ncbi:hypothetical protein Lesp02_29440 [Lentzea sp. NBRC 105346]|uniref:hypothetical protein n=1 Tax=Lentzea sp. NBRC 105346 TaxID=3032205 RepID=UPI0024A4836A|nr:hypothetical protein [Lentzea sp. NBRC 105346]GLZ30755.1 hypothetical protein Lesp02_29440 [Lentzea sp. NBRC 105346]
MNLKKIIVATGALFILSGGGIALADSADSQWCPIPGRKHCGIQSVEPDGRGGTAQDVRPDSRVMGVTGDRPDSRVMGVTGDRPDSRVMGVTGDRPDNRLGGVS